jgi:MraZ protein
VLFTGEYEHTIDAKNRLAIPADIRSRLDPEKDGEAFYVVLGPQRVLWLYPDRYFEQLAESMEQALLSDESLLEYDQLAFPMARRLEIDTSGRVRLPDVLLKRSGVKQHVTLIGVRDHLEVRDTEQWQVEVEQRLANQSAIFMAARRKLAEREKDRAD